MYQQTNLSRYRVTTLPRYKKATLANGLRVLTSRMLHTQAVCIAIFIGVGSRYESDQEAGISHFIEHLCFRGTYNRPTALDISEAIEGVGGVLNGATDKELTFYWCKVTRKDFERAAEVLADMLLKSRFDPEDIEKERQIIIEEIHMCKDSPSQQAGMLIDGLLWNQHPLGRDIAGTAESVAGISRAMLLNYLNSKYTPDNTLVTVTGNIPHDEILEVVDRWMGNWSNPGQPPQYLSFQEQTGPRLKIEKRDTEQAHLNLAIPGISLSDPRRFQLDLLNVILGEGMSSRLFSEIRDKMGLAYSISSYVEHFLDSGAFTISASVDPDNLHRAVTAILGQLNKLKDGIPEAEVEKAREISKGRLILRMEDSRNVAGWLGGQEILLKHILRVDEVLKIIDSITAEELQQAARELIDDSKARLAVVGPISDPTPLQKLLKI